MPKPPARSVVAAALVVAFSALGSATSPPHAHASLVVAVELGELTARADRIVVGEVVAVTSMWDRSGKRIFTNVEVRVGEVWKGGVPTDGTIVVQQAGGQVGDIEMRVIGQPRFAVGDRAVLFLRGTAGITSVLGLGQGMRPLRFDVRAQRWMVLGGDRSAAVLPGARGRLVPAPDEPARPLEDLRADVRRLVQR